MEGSKHLSQRRAPGGTGYRTGSRDTYSTRDDGSLLKVIVGGTGVAATGAPAVVFHTQRPLTPPRRRMGLLVLMMVTLPAMVWIVILILSRSVTTVDSRANLLNREWRLPRSIQLAEPTNTDASVAAIASPILTVGREWEQEKQKAFDYLESIQGFNRTLKFFHIPKTAGTAVEHAAGKQRISWGSCMFNHQRKRDDCRYPRGGKWPEHIGWWHIPRQFFPIRQVDPYQGAELFAIVRDPYDRMVSEYYYICTLKVFSWRPDQCDRTRLGEKSYMNEWLQNKLHNQIREIKADRYLSDNGHFTPQYDFIFGPHEMRMIDFVLPMNVTLEQHFHKLTYAYQLNDVKLEKHNALGAQDRGSDGQFTVEDLDATTQQLIRETFPNDFCLVGMPLK